MTKTLSTNYADTAISGVSSLNFERGLVNFGADFKVKSNLPNEVVLTNLTSPIIYPERIRISVSDVANVYTGSSVEPSLYSPTKRGVSLLVQLTEVMKVTDSADSSLEIALPLSAHLVVKVPNHELVTPALIQSVIGRLISSLYETGSTDPDRLAGMLRGSLLPKDI